MFSGFILCVESSTWRELGAFGGLTRFLGVTGFRAITRARPSSGGRIALRLNAAVSLRTGNYLVVVQFIAKRAKRAIIVSQRTRHIARLAQIPSASLGTGSSLRKERLFRMTIKLTPLAITYVP